MEIVLWLLWEVFPLYLYLIAPFLLLLLHPGLAGSVAAAAAPASAAAVAVAVGVAVAVVGMLFRQPSCLPSLTHAGEHISLLRSSALTCWR